MPTPKVRSIAIADLILDDQNANRGTERGRELLEQSLKKFGTGRSILVDKNNRVLAGNKTVEQARALGHTHVLVIDSDGDTLVAVQRGDLDLTKDAKAQGLAVADNRVAELDLNWDHEKLSQSLDAFGFDQEDLRRGLEASAVREVTPKPAPKTVWVLVGVPLSKYDEAQESIASLEKLSNVFCQVSRK